ncbi:MAG TPA: uroporphyrinogen decarboxylase family protein, partial [Planctomycetota bacterium]|nr:uroporphyrinogen decarboxylase family protein [Planctomycetota bacterium]
MLGEVDDKLRDALEVDVVGLPGRTNLYGFENAGWKPFELFDGTPVLVPGAFNVTVDRNGDLLIYPQGDTSAPPSGRMPKGGFYFDTIIRQQPIDDAKLDPADNLEEFSLLSDAQVQDFAHRAETIARQTDCGMIISLPGAGLGDIALVPAPFLKHPKGIRDVEEWYVSTVLRREYVREVFAKQTEIAVENIKRLGKAVGGHAQAAFVCGTDFGTQRGPFISRQAYRDLYSPFYKRINRAVHQHTPWKTFKHSCGSVVDLLPDFIDDGFDILNPVQCSAAGMDPRTLKKEFGTQITFWGGGVDTQKTLPFGTPEEVYREVRERIDIFNDGGGFVFNTIHNIQATTPVENMLAMLRAIRDSSRG